jgi:hypothetical protein
MKILATVLAVLFLSYAWAEEQQHSYVGAAKCAKMCHKSAKQGEQLPIWEKSKHADAYKVLATPAALATAKKAGITGDPQKSDKCLKCHVTGFGVDAKLKEATYAIEEGVGCEVCHGAGKDYAKLNIMKDKKQAIAAGLVLPDEKTCVKCHNQESPNYKPFDFKVMAAKIAHPVPKDVK